MFTIVLQLYNFVVALGPDFYKFIYWVAIVMAVLKLAKLKIKFDNLFFSLVLALRSTQSYGLDQSVRLKVPSTPTHPHTQTFGAPPGKLRS